MDRQIARNELILVLQHASAGELAAALAYRGHWTSLRDPVERQEIKQIEADEVHHRSRIGEMLSELGAAPDPRLERKLRFLGSTIAMLCRMGGWFIPMYGAGRLERPNIKEYEDAARYAHQAGETRYIEEFLTWAEIEWDHERYFREKVGTRWMRYLFPMWSEPPPRESIRATFEEFRSSAGHAPRDEPEPGDEPGRS